jgi:hypothetical protein
MGRVRVGWTENPTHEEKESGLELHPHPRVKIQTRTRRVSVPIGFVKGAGPICKWVCTVPPESKAILEQNS